MTHVDVINQSTIDGNLLRLPNMQLDRKLYVEVKKALEGIGGIWKGGKTAAFVFNSDPTDLLNRVAGGEKLNLKKQYQFFATPDDLAKEMVEIAFILPNNRVLEPSCGQGAIVKHMNDAGVEPVCFEPLESNIAVMKNLGLQYDLKGPDFLAYYPSVPFDRIVANPPFSKNADINHIMRMYSLLAAGGRLVALSSMSWCQPSNRKQESFCEWLESIDAHTREIPRGTFKASGTMVGAMLITIDKPNTKSLTQKSLF